MVEKIKNGSWLHILPYLSFVAFGCLFALQADGPLYSVIALTFLAASIMTSVYHAEEIAHAIGESLGTLVLALSVTVIEVGLIVSLMTTAGADSSTVARDTVFSAVMIVCNGIVGICLLLGGLRFKELGFQFRGASSLLVVLITLSVFCFVLPNYTVTALGPFYTSGQLIFVSVISLALYVALVFFQTRTHQHYFETEEAQAVEPVSEDSSPRINAWTHFAALVFGLVSVIALAKFLAPSIESGVAKIGAPKEVVGLLIATIVLLPEAFTAISAARKNRLQTSLNLALGSGAASIALTVPVVSLFSIMRGQPLLLGIDAKNTVFLVLTFMVGGMTLGGAKATSLQGAIHLIILLAFFAMTVMP